MTAAVQARSRDALRNQAVDLILHQGNQRRNDKGYRCAGCDIDKRRQLEAQRLAAARREDDERVALRQHRVDRFALQRAKRLCSPSTGGEVRRSKC
jgi:hypothetical protein